MEYRTSTRWFHEDLSFRKVFAIPFVSKSGKLSINTLYFWRAYPEQVLLSMISTVYSRILKILIKRFDYVGRRLRDACIKVSAVYMINKDDYVIDRFLGMARKGTPIKHVSNFAHYCAIQLDEDKRFVYSQALYRADWLKFQVSRPGDKSSKHLCHPTHLRGILSEVQDKQPKEHGQLFSKFCNFFTTERGVSYEERAHSLGSLEFSSFISEPLYDIDGFSEDD